MAQVFDVKTVHFFVDSEDEIQTDPQDVPYYAINLAESIGNRWIRVHSVKAEIPRPIPEVFVPQQIAVLQEQIREVQAAAGSHVNRLEEKIANLLAIGGPT